MHTEKMKTKFGNDSKDQVIVHDGDRRVFVSYGTPIAEIAGYGGAVTLDKDYWDYSVTTGQYRNEFLGEGIADTRKKIKDGTYQLTNLAPRKANKAGDYVINWPEAGAEAAREECLTCDAAITDGGTWGYCVECWEEHGIKVGFGSEDRQGIHTKTYPNGATYRGYYLNDKRHGAGIKTHADGKRVHCVYEHGVLLADPISPMELFLAFGRCTENLNNEASE